MTKREILKFLKWLDTLDPDRLCLIAAQCMLRAADKWRAK